MDQPKIERLLRLMKMLTGNMEYSVAELAEKLEMSVRTVYRYIDTFREAGFVIKKKGDVFRIDHDSPYFKDISKLIHFTEEEAYILKSAIESIDENNLLKQNLKKKLYTVYDYKILADTITHSKNSQIVNALTESFEEKKQVLLCNYSSAHGKDIRSRRVEAFSFTTNYVQVWAFDTEKQENRLFNLSRVEKVEILPDDWQFENQHQEGFIDIFRISTSQRYPVKLRLGILSASLLMEEYPLSDKFLHKISDNEYLLETEVCSFDGIGRFVLGLFNDIQIIDSPEFSHFLQEKLKLFQEK